MKKLVIVTIFIAGLIVISTAQEITVSSFPMRNHFFPRNASNQGVFTVSGNCAAGTSDSIKLRISKNNTLWKTLQVKPLENGAFSLLATIDAELSEYAFDLYFKNTLITSANNIVCGDVFVFLGQSNMGKGGYISNKSIYMRSFGTWDVIAQDSTWKRNPIETGGIALKMAELIISTYNVPVCILNGAKGGTPIDSFLPLESNHFDSGFLYGKLLSRIKKAGLQNSAKAFFWYQGEADGISPNSDYYSEKFDKLYNALKQDLPSISKFYVFQINIGCTSVEGSIIREVQRQFPKKYPDVFTMSTIGTVNHDGCHYDTNGYKQIGTNIFKLVARDFYYSHDTIDINPPDIQCAYYKDETKKTIILKLNQLVKWPNDTFNTTMKDYFYLDNTFGLIDSGYIDDVNIILSLKQASNATRISYLPPVQYYNTKRTYFGPFIRNSRQIGLFSFHNAELSAPVSFVKQAAKQPSSCKTNNTVNNYYNLSGQKIPLSLVKIGLYVVENGLQKIVIKFRGRPK